MSILRSMNRDYRAMVLDALQQIAENSKQIDALSEESAKLMRFVRATIPLLPAKDSDELLQMAEEAVREKDTQASSLTQAIRNVLIHVLDDWLTVAQVRSMLMDAGFDFSGYQSNPLASVSTTLKRLAEKGTDIESRDLEGVAVYRFKRPRGTQNLIGAPKETLSQRIWRQGKKDKD